MKNVIFISLLVTYFLLVSNSAIACPPVTSYPSYPLCEDELKLGKDLPSQAKGIVWHFNGTLDAETVNDNIELTKTTDGSDRQQVEINVQTTDVPGKFLIVPTEGFDSIFSYVLKTTLPTDAFPEKAVLIQMFFELSK